MASLAQLSNPSPTAAPSAPARYVSIFRAIFFCCGLAALGSNIGADLSVLGIFIAGLIGADIGYRAARLKSIYGTHLTHRGFFTTLLALGAMWLAVRFVGDHINPGAGAFSWYVFSRSLELYLVIGAMIGVFEWLYRRTESWLTVEGFTIGALAISALAAHRFFRLDTPRTIASIAWDWNANPIGVFIGVGAGLAAIIVLFLAICAKPKASRSQPIKRKVAISGAIFALALISIVAVVAFKLTSIAAGSRLMNGVGQNNEEGVSPLTFQSALGASNQPAAIVRLEGDYAENPNTPMLYMREDALSEYNGTEMVHAGGAYDTDVISSGPDHVFKAEEDASLLERVPLPHSVYLLADHKIPFAIDFPISLIPLKNPNPGKFKGGAYRVYSQAPVYKLQDLSHESVGNPNWDEVERQHYLKTNPDPRYQNLAVEITKEVTNPVERAFSLAAYLSKKSIYTLSPNHEETKGDLTAPYIFGDFRGYCVHFAHAMVYMLRSVGIPSRIGTGYLTDLSQSKDGHILLRMSDRHAWAEVYVTNKGWVPFDVQPEQVESHGDSEVDQKLLEDLMSQLDPGEEILPKEPAKPEKALEKDMPIAWQSYVPRLSEVAIVLALIFLSLVLLKAFLKYAAWRLPLAPATRVAIGYRAQAMNVADFGLSRIPAETRAEFEQRASKIVSEKPLSLTRALNEIRFSQGFNEINLAKTSVSLPSPRTFLGKLRSALSPFSILRFFNP